MMFNRFMSLSSSRVAVKHRRPPAGRKGASLARVAAAFAVAVAVAGCDFFSSPEAAAPAPTPTIPDAQRPPLRVAVSSRYPGLAASLERRWATVSEQPLEVIAAEELLGGERVQADVWIMPAMTLATMVEGKFVTPLPDGAVGPIAPPEGKAAAGTSLPAAWVKSGTYGQRLYGRPLGLSLVLARAHAADNPDPVPDGADGADRADGATRALIADWQRVAVRPPGGAAEAYPPDAVDVFLAIAAAKRPRAYEASLLFTELGFKPRLLEPWMVEAAAATAACLRRESAGPSAELVVGWENGEGVRDGVSVDSEAAGGDWLPLATPSPDAAGSASEQQVVPETGAAVSTAEVEPGRLAAVDAGHAPLVLLSSSTRQSARAIFFLRWFDEPGVVAAVAGELPWAVPLGPAAAEGSYRRAVLRLSDLRELPAAFAIPEALRYRETLLTTLRTLVEADEGVDAAEAMRRCAQQWEAITESAGRGNQEAALDRVLGLSR